MLALARGLYLAFAVSVRLRRVALEGAGRRKFAELVAHHVFRAIDRNELAAVVHGDRVADHVGVNGRPARPGLDDLLFVAAFIASILTIRCVSMNGPFFVERAIFVTPVLRCWIRRISGGVLRLGFALAASRVDGAPPGAALEALGLETTCPCCGAETIKTSVRLLLRVL